MRLWRKRPPKWHAPPGTGLAEISEINEAAARAARAEWEKSQPGCLTQVAVVVALIVFFTGLVVWLQLFGLLP